MSFDAPSENWGSFWAGAISGFGFTFALMTVACCGFVEVTETPPEAYNRGLVEGRIEGRIEGRDAVYVEQADAACESACDGAEWRRTEDRCECSQWESIR